MKKTGGKATIFGRVFLIDDEETGQIVVLIAGDDNRDYVVEPGGAADRLSELEGETVQVSGPVRRRDGDVFVKVQSYEVLEEETDLDDEFLYDEDYQEFDQDRW